MKTAEKKNFQEERIKEKEMVFCIVILTFLVLMLPHIIRFYNSNPSLTGEQAYYHQREAESIIDSGRAGINQEDNLIYQRRNYQYLPYHFAMAGVGSIFGTDMASRLLPFIFGIFSLIIFYHLLKSFGARPFSRFIICILLAVSPPFIYLFTVSTPSCMSISLTLLGLVLFMSRKRALFAVSLACFLAVSLSGIFNALLIVALLFFISAIKEENRNKALIAAIAIAAVYIIYPSRFYYNFDYPATDIFRTLISDLGAGMGFSIFGTLLAAIGLFHSWKNKSRFFPLYALLALLMASSLYIGEETHLYSAFILAVFAAIGLDRLSRIEWRFDILKNLTFIVVGCGLLFSTASYLNRMPQMLPSGSIAESLGWLKENSNAGQFVLSHHSKGYWIESIAERPVFADGISISSNGHDRIYADMQAMFYSIDLDDTVDLFRKYNVSFVWIDSEMKQDLVWSKEKEGLLYLFRNNRTFDKVYENDGVEIWKVRGVY